MFSRICHETSDFFIVPIEERNSETLLTVIKGKIEPGTTISDFWHA